jgi:adenylate cyclase class IV
MIETEVKILEIEEEKTYTLLLDFGSKLIFDGTIETIDFELPKEHNQFVRLRIETPHIGTEIFTLVHKSGTKNCSDKIKSFEEKTTNITFEQFNDIEKIFNRGLKKIHHTLKHRKSYLFGNFRIDVDKVLDRKPDIPVFAEIEGPSWESILRMAKMLDFEEGMIKPWSTEDLFKHYGAKT